MARDQHDFDAIEGAAQLTKTKLSEKCCAGVLAALNLIPGVGGALASLLSSTLPDWKMGRVRDFLLQFAADVERLEAKVDKNGAATIEFGLLLEHTARQVTQTSDKDAEKLRAFRAIAVNALLPSPPSKMEQDYFLGLVERLQEIHVLLIALFRDQITFGAAHGVRVDPAILTGNWFTTIEHYLRPLALPSDLVDAATRDLDRMGILPGLHDHVKVMMSPGGASNLGSRLKGLGRRFADFIELPPELRDSTAPPTS